MLFLVPVTPECDHMGGLGAEQDRADVRLRALCSLPQPHPPESARGPAESAAGGWLHGRPGESRCATPAFRHCVKGERVRRGICFKAAFIRG